MQNSKYQKAIELTKWEEVIPMKFYFQAKHLDLTTKWCELNNCPICYCPVFDELTVDEEEEISPQTSD